MLRDEGICRFPNKFQHYSNWFRFLFKSPYLEVDIFENLKVPISLNFVFFITFLNLNSIRIELSWSPSNIPLYIVNFRL